MAKIIKDPSGIYIVRNTPNAQDSPETIEIVQGRYCVGESVLDSFIFWNSSPD